MNRIKEVLEEKGIKQTWLSEKLGKSYNMVNGYVQNRQQPRLEVLYEIANLKKKAKISPHMEYDNISNAFYIEKRDILELNIILAG